MECNHPVFDISVFCEVHFILRYGESLHKAISCNTKWEVYRDKIKYHSMFPLPGCHDTTEINAKDLETQMNNLLGCIDSEYNFEGNIDCSEREILKSLPDFFGEMLCDASLCARSKRDEEYWKPIYGKGNEQLLSVVQKNMLRIIGK